MGSNYSSDNIPEIALSWVSLGEPVVWQLLLKLGVLPRVEVVARWLSA